MALPQPGVAVAEGPAAHRRTHRRYVWALAPLFLLLLLWLWLFYAEGAIRGGPNGKGFGADLAMFVGAAKVLHDGGNPYDHALLYRTESALLRREHLPILQQAAVVRVGNPPLLFWTMQPLTGRPFGPLAVLIIVVLEVLTALAFLAVLHYFGWRRRLLPAVLFLLMPQTIFGPFYGNVVVLVFAGIAAALAVMRPRPFLAGALLTVAWLKPPVALPLLLLIVLFHAPRRTPLLSGFVVATLVELLVTIVTTGPSRLVEWVQGMVGYSRAIGSSPDVASFAGLYVRTVPAPYRTGIEALAIAAAISITALVWHHYRSVADLPFARVGWLWALWFLATPYAHFFDEVLLAIPVMAAMGIDASHFLQRENIAALYLGFASLLVISAAPGGFQLLWLPLVAVMLCLYLAGRSMPASPSRRAVAA